MKFFTLSLLMLMATATTASSDALYWDEDAVKGLCTTEWGSDYQMISYCIDTNRDGFDEYSQLKDLSESKGGLFDAPFTFCQTEWGFQWDMVAFCAQNQVTAFVQYLNILEELPADVQQLISDRCAAEWRPDMTMIAYCTENQAAGWHSIND